MYIVIGKRWVSDQSVVGNIIVCLYQVSFTILKKLWIALHFSSVRVLMANLTTRDEIQCSVVMHPIRTSL